MQVEIRPRVLLREDPEKESGALPVALMRRNQYLPFPFEGRDPQPPRSALLSTAGKIAY